MIAPGDNLDGMAKKVKLGPYDHKAAMETFEDSEKEAGGIKTGKFTRIASPKEIRTVRRSFKLTQEKMAHALGMSRSTIEAWEQGKRSPDGLNSKIFRLLEKQPRLLKELEKA